MMCNCNANMGRSRVQFLLLFAVIVVASCASIDDERSASKLSKDDPWPSLLDAKTDTKLTESDFSYVVRTETKTPCTLANMTISMVVPTGEPGQTKTLKVPKTATVEGTCSRVISEMKLSWKEEGENAEENHIRFTLVNDHRKFSIFSIDLDIYLAEKTPTKSKGKRFNAKSDIDLRLFDAFLENEIHVCDRESRRKVGDAEVIMKDVSLIAFNTDDSISSRRVSKCSATDDKTTLKTFPYVVKNPTADICILAAMRIAVNVPIKTKEPKDVVYMLMVPDNVKVTGDCDSESSRMILTWSELSKASTFASSETENVVEFGFTKDDANTYVSSISIDIFLDERNFGNAENVGERYKAKATGSLFVATAKNGIHSCAHDTQMKLDDGYAYIRIWNVLLVTSDIQTDYASKHVEECKGPLTENDFNYVVQDAQGWPRTLANMSISMTVPCKNGDTNTVSMLTVPKNVDVTGACDNKTSEMKLTWPHSPKKDTMNTLTFYIARNASDFFVYHISTSVYLDGKICSSKWPVLINGSTEFGTELFSGPAVEGAHKCTNNTQEIQVDDIRLRISDVVLIPFNHQSEISTLNVRYCSDGTNTGTSSSTSSSTESTSSSTESTSSSTESTTSSSSTDGQSTTPVPDPSAKDYNYVVTDPETHIPCILANMSISIKIPYQAKDSKTKETTLKVPTAAKTSGKCGNASSTMELVWSEEGSNEQNTVTFTFGKDESKSVLRSIRLDINMDEKHFPDAVAKKYEAVSGDIDIYSASLNCLYKCDPETSVKANEAGITIGDVTLIVFNLEKSVASKPVENCIVETGSDVGAIVGGIIGAIILIGIIVFLWFMYKRRRRFA